MEMVQTMPTTIKKSISKILPGNFVKTRKQEIKNIIQIIGIITLFFENRINRVDSMFIQYVIIDDLTQSSNDQFLIRFDFLALEAAVESNVEVLSQMLDLMLVGYLLIIN